MEFIHKVRIQFNFNVRPRKCLKLAIMLQHKKTNKLLYVVGFHLYNRRKCMLCGFWFCNHSAFVDIFCNGLREPTLANRFWITQWTTCRFSTHDFMNELNRSYSFVDFRALQKTKQKNLVENLHSFYRLNVKIAIAHSLRLRFCKSRSVNKCALLVKSSTCS